MIRVLDMTKLFTKEILMYSMFDIQFSRPIRLKYVAYLLVWILFWATPIMILTWFPNAYVLMIALGVPFLAAHYMSKPIWGGKSFMQWLTCQLKYIFNPKKFYDGKVSKEIDKYKINSKFTISRRRDFMTLLEMKRNGL